MVAKIGAAACAFGDIGAYVTTQNERIYQMPQLRGSRS